MSPQACATQGHCLAFWPSVYLLPAMVRRKRCLPRHLPLVGIAANRFAGRLILRLFCKAPSLHRHYPASSLLRASPPPSGPLTVMDSRFALVPHRPGGLPRFLDRSLRTRRLQPPRGSGPVLADCFPDRAGFILVGGLADPTSLTRPNRVSLALRLMRSPSRGFNPPGFPSDCSRATCLISNLHGELLPFTRPASLILAHRL